MNEPVSKIEKQQNLEQLKQQLLLLEVVTEQVEQSLVELYSQAISLRLIQLGDCLTVRDMISKAGLDRDADDIHRLLLIMFASLNYGSLCVELEAEKMAEIIYIKPLLGDSPVSAAERVIKLVFDERLELLICTDGHRRKPLVASDKYLYFQKYYRYENSLKKRLHLFLAADSHLRTHSVNELCQLVKACSAYSEYSLNKEQLAGVYLAICKNFLIISGGPGTGKTTIVTSLLRALYHCGVDLKRVRMIAPTGRAGQRMGESIQATVSQINNEPQELCDQLNRMSGSTVHSLLTYDPSKNSFVYNEYNPLPVDVIIVDEVSMIDVALMDSLLAALKLGTKIIFLGDKNQLPSVGAGAVLSDLIPQNDEAEFSADTLAELKQLHPELELNLAATYNFLTDHVVLLTETHRCRGSILKVAEEVNAGSKSCVDEIPVFCSELKFKNVQLASSKRGGEMKMRVLDADWTSEQRQDQCFLLPLESNGRKMLKEILKSWIYCFFAGQTGNDDESYQQLVGKAEFSEDELLSQPEENTIVRLKKIFEKLQYNRILTLVREGDFGCNGINRQLAGEWRPCFDRSSKAGKTVFAGAPIMITRNSRLQNLYNGDVGVVVKTDHNRYFGVFKRGERFIALPVQTLPEYELAFAVTVHKSQGSEYDNVLMILPEYKEHALLTREIIYTGLTRAKNMAVIVGSKTTLETAISNKIVRQSGIDLWNSF